MTDTWFHATPEGGRNGPMRADDLLRLFQAGRIHGATPVWREGMADWGPLASVATALGLPAMPPPPRAPAQPPPRRGLHWIWIVVLVLAGLAVPVLAILAAIALPAYSDYRIRSGIVQIVADSAPLRMAVARSHAETGTCPATGAALRSGASLPQDASMAGGVAPLLAHPHIGNVWTGRGADGRCAVRIDLEGFDRDDIDSTRLDWSLDPASGAWTCLGTAGARQLPAGCRP
ncbi:GYF domain-containing protein [Luteimonas sp. XNQY3]|nr:GYF domain-containing protein [Luteimonas sp. XNQY3]MCD9007003.1 GYF domain-containing protein [Luteimonas sp. XNQY3]